MNEELKPCPNGNCNGIPLKKIIHLDIYEFTHIQCNDCHCRTNGYSDPKKAINAWNNKLCFTKEQLGYK